MLSGVDEGNEDTDGGVVASCTERELLVEFKLPPSSSSSISSKPPFVSRRRCCLSKWMWTTSEKEGRPGFRGVVSVDFCVDFFPDATVCVDDVVDVGGDKVAVVLGLELLVERERKREREKERERKRERETFATNVS